VTPLRTVALAVVVALPLGALVSQVFPQRREELGPKLRRECVSLVETVLKEITLSRLDLQLELANRGVSVPQPSSDPSLSMDPRNLGKGIPESQQREYEAAEKAFEADWDVVNSSVAYREAWDSVHSRKREKAIKECVIKRAHKEGVEVR
jgi:hypothetical protein